MSESILENPWFIAATVTLLVLVALLLLLVFCPRADEIKRLKKRIAEQAAVIDKMSKEGTDAALEYVADLEQIRGAHAADALAFATELQGAEAREKSSEARAEQFKDLNRQIADAADKMKARATA